MDSVFVVCFWHFVKCCLSCYSYFHRKGRSYWSVTCKFGQIQGLWTPYLSLYSALNCSVICHLLNCVAILMLLCIGLCYQSKKSLRCLVKLSVLPWAQISTESQNQEIWKCSRNDNILCVWLDCICRLWESRGELCTRQQDGVRHQCHLCHGSWPPRHAWAPVSRLPRSLWGHGPHWWQQTAGVSAQDLLHWGVWAGCVVWWKRGFTRQVSPIEWNAKSIEVKLGELLSSCTIIGK